MEFARHLGLDVRGHVRTPVYHVPLVHRQRQPHFRFEGVPRDVDVLRGDALGGIGHQDGDVGPLERVGGAQQRVFLDALFDPASAADAGGVHQHDAAPVEFDELVDAVARRARDLAHDGALRSDERVEEAGLAHVGPTDDRDAWIRGLLIGHRRRELLHDLVEQVAGADALDRGDGEDLPQTELVELGGLRLPPPRVGLVRDEEDGLAAATQKIGHVVLDREDAGLRVEHERQSSARRSNATIAAITSSPPTPRSAI